MKKIFTLFAFVAFAQLSFAQCNYVFYIDPQGDSSAIIYVNHSDSDPNLSFLWSWGDNTYDTTPWPSHTYANDGTYTVCLIVTDNIQQCADTFCQPLTILPGNTPFPVDVILLTVGIEEQAHGNFHIYPNPVNDRMIINSDFMIDDLPVTISDISGRSVYSAEMNGKELNCEFLESGIYLISIETPSGRLTQRFIKQ